MFVDRGNVDHTVHVLGEVAALDVISYNRLKVIVTSLTRSSLNAIFTTLRQHLRPDADIVIFNAALIKQVLKAIYPRFCLADCIRQPESRWRI